MELTPADERQAQLLELGERGYRIFRAADLDATYDPWLAADDGSVWASLPGEPRGGRTSATHAVVVRDDGSWGWLTAASATGWESAPRDLAELDAKASVAIGKRSGGRRRRGRTWPRSA
jgi:hypothetical protein